MEKEIITQLPEKWKVSFSKRKKAFYFWHEEDSSNTQWTFPLSANSKKNDLLTCEKKFLTHQLLNFCFLCCTKTLFPREQFEFLVCESFADVYNTCQNVFKKKNHFYFLSKSLDKKNEDVLSLFGNLDSRGLVDTMNKVVLYKHWFDSGHLVNTEDQLYTHYSRQFSKWTSMWSIIHWREASLYTLYSLSRHEDK